MIISAGQCVVINIRLHYAAQPNCSYSIFQIAQARDLNFYLGHDAPLTG